MNNLVFYAKIVALAELAIIILIVVAFYAVKVFLTYRNKKKLSVRTAIKKMIMDKLHDKAYFTPEEITYCKKNVVHFLSSFYELGDDHSEHLAQLKAQLSELVFKEAARKKYSSHSWFDRFIAAICYGYGFEAQDEPRILCLIKDHNTLVSLNAAKAAVKFNSPDLVNEMLDIFSQGTHLQQAAYAEILVKGNTNVSTEILNRFHTEKNLDVKLFCYDLLSSLPFNEEIASTVKEDVQVDSVEMKKAILSYFMHVDNTSKDEVVYSLAQDPDWEVRAAAAQTLSTVKDKESIIVLQHLLSDTQGYVSDSAAKSLTEKGEAGIKILLKQTGADDKFTSAAAQTALESLKHNHAVQYGEVQK